MKKEIMINIHSTGDKLVETVNLVQKIHDEIVRADIYGDGDRLVWTMTHATAAKMAHLVGQDSYVVKAEIVDGERRVLAAVEENFIIENDFRPCEVYCEATGDSVVASIAKYFVDWLTVTI